MNIDRQVSNQGLTPVQCHILVFHELMLQAFDRCFPGLYEAV